MRVKKWGSGCMRDAPPGLPLACDGEGDLPLMMRRSVLSMMNEIPARSGSRAVNSRDSALNLRDRAVNS